MATGDRATPSASGKRRRSFWGVLWSELNAAGRLIDSEEGERRERERALVDVLAQEASRTGFGSAAMLIAESARPLSRLGSHALHFLTPSAGFLLGEQRLRNLACLLEDRGNLERFADKVEELEERRGDPARPER
jgi:hypothetical protein